MTSALFLAPTRNGSRVRTSARCSLLPTAMVARHADADGQPSNLLRTSTENLSSRESRRNRVLLISHDLVGPRMAGPGIRTWELSHILAREFQVTLAVPGDTSLSGEGFDLISYSDGKSPTLERLENIAREQTDVVIASGNSLRNLPFLHKLATPLVADVYIPVAVESLAWHASSEPEQQMGAYQHSWEVTQVVARYADFFICASERQRDFWLGVLAAHGRLRQELYTADPDLRNLIDVVPFGCPARPPQPGAVLKGVWPGIGPQDRVILWGGGVWNWFDPISLLRAMPKVLERHPEAKLVFMGANHPDHARVPEMECARQARALSKDLGLEGRSVFWGDWVPYTERGAYLLEADVGVSLHRTGAEVRLAFRTRLLDAIWTGLPMVLTRGDVLANEFERLGIGYGVDVESVDQIAQAINTLLDEANARSSRQPAFERLRQRFNWEHVSEPLQQFCRAPLQEVGKTQAMDMADAEAKKERATLQAEIARLQQAVHGYESGRIMRTLAALHEWRHRVLRS